MERASLRGAPIEDNVKLNPESAYSFNQLWKDIKRTLSSAATAAALTASTATISTTALGDSFLAASTAKDYSEMGAVISQTPAQTTKSESEPTYNEAINAAIEEAKLKAEKREFNNNREYDSFAEANKEVLKADAKKPAMVVNNTEQIDDYPNVEYADGDVTDSYSMENTYYTVNESEPFNEHKAYNENGKEVPLDVDEPTPAAGNQAKEQTVKTQELQSTTYTVHLGDNLWKISAEKLQQDGFDPNGPDFNKQVIAYQEQIFKNNQQFTNKNGEVDANAAWNIHPGDTINLPSSNDLSATLDAQGLSNRAEIVKHQENIGYGADNAANNSFGQYSIGINGNLSRRNADGTGSFNDITSDLKQNGFIENISLRSYQADSMKALFEGHESPENGVVKDVQIDATGKKYSIWYRENADGTPEMHIIGNRKDVPDDLKDSYSAARKGTDSALRSQKVTIHSMPDEVDAIRKIRETDASVKEIKNYYNDRDLVSKKLTSADLSGLEENLNSADIARVKFTIDKNSDLNIYSQDGRKAAHLGHDDLKFLHGETVFVAKFQAENGKELLHLNFKDGQKMLVDPKQFPVRDEQFNGKVINSTSNSFSKAASGIEEAPKLEQVANPYAPDPAANQKQYSMQLTA